MNEDSPEIKQDSSSTETKLLLGVKKLLSLRTAVTECYPEIKGDRDAIKAKILELIRDLRLIPPDKMFSALRKKAGREKKGLEDLENTLKILNVLEIKPDSDLFKKIEGTLGEILRKEKKKEGTNLISDVNTSLKEGKIEDAKNKIKKLLDLILKQPAEIELDGKTLTLEDIWKIVLAELGEVKIELPDRAKEKMQGSREFIKNEIEDGEVIYGVNTGLGGQGSRRVPYFWEFPKSIPFSHDCATGEPLPWKIAMIMMIIRANTLARGNSGFSPEKLEKLIEMINCRITPVIPREGSVGASGDLALLTRLLRTLQGDGKAWHPTKVLSESGGKAGREEEGRYEYRISPIDVALKQVNLKPFSSDEMEPKETLAFINGTAAMTATLIYVLREVETLTKFSYILTALNLSARLGKKSPFDPLIQEVRPYPGQIQTAEAILRILEGNDLADRSLPRKREEVKPSEDGVNLSEEGGKLSKEETKSLLKELKDKEPAENIQDPYSTRCTPQVYGAVREALDQVRKILETEINSATDNPLVFPKEEKILSGGNFHGDPLAYPFMNLKLALAKMSNISFERTSRLLEPAHNKGLPSSLSPHPGRYCGYMIPLYASADQLAEVRTLSAPASVHNLPVSEGQEDYSSFVATDARLALRMTELSRKILAGEILTTCQAIDLRLRNLRIKLTDQEKIRKMLGPGCYAAYQIVRKEVVFLRKDDHRLNYDLERIIPLVPRIVRAVEKEAGPLFV